MKDTFFWYVFGPAQAKRVLGAMPYQTFLLQRVDKVQKLRLYVQIFLLIVSCRSAPLPVSSVWERRERGVCMLRPRSKLPSPQLKIASDLHCLLIFEKHSPLRPVASEPFGRDSLFGPKIWIVKREQ